MALKKQQTTMRYFKMQLGTNPHVFDVLTIADDGTMSMDCRVCERLVHYDGLTMEHTPHGDRINYGNGSSMPWTDKKGNISARWTEVPCNDAITTDAKVTTEDVKGTPSQNEGTPEDSTPAKPETEAEANAEAEAEAPTVTEASAPAEPAEQEQPEVCPAVLPQESQEPQEPQEEESPTPSSLDQMQAELEALRQENEELRMKNEEFSQREQAQERQRRDKELQAIVERELNRQLHRSRSRRVSDGQRQDIDPANNHQRTDESEQPATARRKPTVRRWLKPLAVAAASVMVCIVIYETGLLIPMGLIGLATSGLVK